MSSRHSLAEWTRREGMGPTTADARPVRESQVQAAVLDALRLHPRVAWRKRINSGFVMIEDRPFRAGFKGCSDIIGQMRDGRFLAVEVKRPGEKPTAEQAAFLDAVRGARGVAFVATSAIDVFREIPV